MCRSEDISLTFSHVETAKIFAGTKDHRHDDIAELDALESILHLLCRPGHWKTINKKKGLASSHSEALDSSTRLLLDPTQRGWSLAVPWPLLQDMINQLRAHGLAPHSCFALRTTIDKDLKKLRTLYELKDSGDTTGPNPLLRMRTACQRKKTPFPIALSVLWLRGQHLPDPTDFETWFSVASGKLPLS